MNDKHLKLSPRVQIIERGDKYIFINPELPAWVVTDKIGSIIISLFDGNRSLNQIIELTLEGLGKSNEVRARQFCNEIVKSGLLNDFKASPKEGRMPLGSVHLSLSDRCNISCIYCYASERKEHLYPRLTLEDYKIIIDDVIDISPDVIFTLTGGEPLLNKDCLLIAEYIRQKNAKVFLLTNGTLINDDNIAKVGQLFNLVTLSIDGPNDKIHSITRGHNLDKVMNAARLLDDNDVDYTISMTVTQKNIGYVEEMAEKFGNRLNFAPYFPIAGEKNELAITGLQYYQALKAAVGVNPLSFCERTLEEARVQRRHKCSVGDGEFSISATGDVYPCQLLHTEQFYAGNTHLQSIKKIYYQSKAIIQAASLDVATMDGCKDCPIKFICGGSCRARAYYENGTINADSDFCKYEQEAFYDGIINIYSQNIIK